MGFEFWPAVVAGFCGALIMTVMMVMMRSAGMTRMDMALMQGAMFTGEETKARAMGMFTHLVIMGALVFGMLYAALFALFDTSAGNAWWVGGLIGVVHGLIAGMAMAMMPAMHPRMRKTAAAQEPAQPLELDPPGMFARNYGSATPPGIIMGHVVYGLVVGVVYAVLT
ncbi:hypothetical protein [Streptomyces sp. YIM 98790]|uniref:hypothetical protein n=1 Tax=Streptomyces sp. YIM 98790 TaxID=2689077 RepID=UPI0014089335|nr:hypothetical protein [Streptomyces sp. YIM 98790]